MASTFLDLTNQLLRRLNEVEIAESEFSSCRGVQALAKDAIKNSIAKINSAEFEWPFNATLHTQVITVGQEEYNWPTYFKSVDWNSFQLQENVSLGVGYTHLTLTSRDQYYKLGKDTDDASGAAGIGVPTNIMPGHGNGFIITPSPNQAYTVKYRYYINHADLVNALDITRIPDTYDHIIIDGALYQVYLFRDNAESAGLQLQIFQQGIKEMQSILINKYETIRDTRTVRIVRSYF